MDEFFAIKQNIGDVSAVINLTGEEEQTQFRIDEFEEKVEPVVEEKKIELDENGQPIENPDGQGDGDGDGDGDGEKKAPAWKPTDYRWTVTNGRPRNLPQLCRDYMSIKF